MGITKLNLTMLYVEDDEDTRISLSEVFSYKVKKLLVAENGVEALKLFKENKVHFIISDYQMPKMNGNILCKEIKAIDSSVPFVLLTAYNDTNLLVNAIDAGVDNFLQKPVESKKLFGIMDNINQKIVDRYKLEKSTVCLQEAEKIALLSYWDVNLENDIISFSQESKELFCLADKLDVDYKSFATIVKDIDKEKFIEIFSKRIYEDEHIDEVISIKNNNSNYIYIHIVAKKWKSSICGNNHVIGLFQDVTHYEIQRLRLLKESQTDPMLNIANKKFLTKELENLTKTSKRYGHHLGVIFFDIDDFKYINDTYGHLIADDILIDLANLIQNDIRQSDEFGRWGGDEFVLVTGYSSPESTIELADKLLQKIKNNSWKNGVEITISIGISFYELGDDVTSLIDRADSKMYEAKKAGKNRYCY